MKFSKYHRKDWDFSFYRTNAGAEVDLIIETPCKKVFAIEIKGTSKIKSKHLSGLKSFSKLYPDAELICASLVENRTRNGNVLVCPWQEVFEILGLAC